MYLQNALFITTRTHIATQLKIAKSAPKSLFLTKVPAVSQIVLVIQQQLTVLKNVSVIQDLHILMKSYNNQI